MKRSNEPIFWSLFGAGGMLSALIGPALVFVTGLAVPLGLLSADAIGYQRMHALAANWAGKLFVFAIVALFLWHAAHRVQLTVHDLGVGTKTVARTLCYGLALLGTLSAAYALLAIG